MRSVVIAASLALGVGHAAPAHAGPLADALARGDDAAIATLRAQAADVGARCTLGAIYARRGDLPRAGLFLDDCHKVELPADIADPVGKIARETLSKLDAGSLASIYVTSTPSGLTAESTALPGEPFTTPATLWVKPGNYEVRTQIGNRIVVSPVIAEAHKRSTVWLTAPPEKSPTAPREQQVSFDENALEEPETGPPPAVKHPNLMAAKYRGAAAVREAGQAGEPILEDPLAVRAGAPRAPRAVWLGARVGGGMFDDGNATARAGLGLALTGRYALPALPAGAFLSARVDWSRRGGAPDMSGSSLDVLGAAAGAGVTLLDRSALAVALLGQLRADLRLASTRGAPAEAEPVRRAGLGAAAGLELALPSTPITAGLRFEQGLTELVSGARDRAFLLEVGVDWR